jgi:hypothetical protein
MSKAQIIDKKIKSFAQREREILAGLIPELREMELCHGYLEFKCTSLFEYLMKEVGYSEGSAQRRIDAARLLSVLPDLPEKLESGAIKLNQISMVRKASRQVKRSLTPEETRDLFAQLEKQNQRESEKMVAQAFELEVLRKSKRVVQSDGSVRYELTISAELDAEIQKAQELHSHSLKSKDLVEYLEFLTAKELKMKKNSPSTATVAVTPKLRREIIQEQCAHVYEDGTQCANRWQMQVDHKKSKWKGGTNERENLQPLCAQHNREKYRREARSPVQTGNVHSAQT